MSKVFHCNTYVCLTSVVKKTTGQILAGHVLYEPVCEELQFDTKHGRIRYHRII